MPTLSAFSHRFRLSLRLLAILSALFSEFSAAEPQKSDEIATALKGNRTPSEGAEISGTPSFEKDFWESLARLESKLPKEQQEGRRLLEKSAAAEFTHAQVTLANCYLSGSSGFEKNPKRAVALFRFAAERGNGFAMVSYAQCLLSGTGIRKDSDLARAWLTKAAADEKAFAPTLPPEEFRNQFASRASSISGTIEVDPSKHTYATVFALLGNLLLESKDPKGAHECFVKAAEAGGTLNGIYQAGIQAALDFAFGQGTEQDMGKANKMLDLCKQLTKRASIQFVHNYVSLKLEDEFALGDMEDMASKDLDRAENELQFQIAKEFLDKTSNHYNPAEAEKWYKLGAENGNDWAKLDLALLYAGGELGKSDPSAAWEWFEKVGDRDFVAIANRAIFLENGIGVAKDSRRASEIFAKYKADNIVCYLGSIGKCPATAMNYDAIATLNEMWAKDRNDATAQYLLGQRYERGWGVKRDRSSAIKWYRKAAKQGQASAMRALSLMLVQDWKSDDGYPKEAQNWMKKAMELGDAEAATCMGYDADQGTYKKRDEDESVRMYLRALELDPKHIRALNNLGAIRKLQAERAVANAQIGKAKTLLAEAIALFQKCPDYSWANMNLGKIYFTRADKFAAVLIEKDNAKAYSYFEKAAEEGDTGCRRRLGDMHIEGIGVPVTPKEAAYHYRLAALDGDENSIGALSKMYLTGKGVRRDPDRALFWSERLSQFDLVHARERACEALILKGDYTDLIKLLKIVEDEEGYFDGGFNKYELSQVYERGLGVKQDKAKASKYFSEAIKAGCGEAFAERGQRYLAEGKLREAESDFSLASISSPRGCALLANLLIERPKKLPDALDLYASAADFGDEEAIVALIKAHLNGLEGAPNLDQALDLADQAENIGSPRAAELRQLLENERDKIQQTDKAL